MGNPSSFKIMAIGMIFVLALVIYGYYQDYKKGKLRK